MLAFKRYSVYSVNAAFSMYTTSLNLLFHALVNATLTLHQR